MKKNNLFSQQLVSQLAREISKNLRKEFGLIQPLSDDVFLTVEELTKLINMTKGSIYGLVHKNAIPYHKKGKLYFLKSEILDWIKSGKRTSKTTLHDKANEYLAKNPFQ